MHVSQADFDRGFPWSDRTASGLLLEEFAKLFPTLSSWSTHVQSWGWTDGNQIDVLVHDGVIEDVRVRLDARNVSVPFVVDLMAIARRFSLVIRLPNGSIVRASPKHLLEAFRRSDAFKFVADPLKFLQSIREIEEHTGNDKHE